MVADRRPPHHTRPRPETVALARQRARAGASLVGGTDLSAEEQVDALKKICRYLWNLLDVRRGDYFAFTAQTVFDDFDDFARAAVDRTFEAALILWGREKVHVEPCRRILRDQQVGTLFYSLVWRDGTTRVVREDELLVMAGLT